MPDHINIHHPDKGERWEREAIAIAELKAKISVMSTALMEVRMDLDSIFTRIERGDEAELNMMNGDVYVIRGVKKNDLA